MAAVTFHWEDNRRAIEEEIDLACVDMDELLKFDPQIRLVFLEEHVTDLEEIIRNRVLASIQTEKYTAADDERFSADLHPCKDTLRDLCPDAEAGCWLRLLTDSKYKKIIQRNLWVLVFAALRVNNTSCHELIFGKHRPSRITIAQEQFIENMARLTKSQRESVMRRLRNNRQIVSNPYYVFVRRLQELQADLGHSSDKMFNFSIPGQNNAVTIRNYTQFMDGFMNEEHKPVMMDKTLRKNSVFFIRTLLYVCGLYDIGADRLLLTDYSDFAVRLNGAELTSWEKLWLSAFQCAEPETRQDVLIWCELNAKRKTGG